MQNCCNEYYLSLNKNNNNSLLPDSIVLLREDAQKNKLISFIVVDSFCSPGSFVIPNEFAS